ncbi:uncharacterized protein LOC129249916 isoform X2 [Anastrepha obliqua]|uniref:uncharacterized protein LOC129249916 isoform X2 n=1 Tax=Anastrepha obliqua TaxID=95512 RepID=UPI0024097DAE|nr:uncharacterized protein LOC129249916 isoform X2 [Anastrepha obliqua]
MPHNSHNSHSRHGGSSSDDLGSTDEVKIFKDEGDREEEKISSENLLEEKSSLIDLTESEDHMHLLCPNTVCNKQLSTLKFDLRSGNGLAILFGHQMEISRQQFETGSHKEVADEGDYRTREGA